MIDNFAIWMILVFTIMHVVSLFSAQRQAHRNGKDLKAMLEDLKVECDDSDPMIEGAKHCIPNVVFGIIGSWVVWIVGYPMPTACFIFLASIVSAVVVIWRYHQIYKSYGASII